MTIGVRVKSQVFRAVIQAIPRDSGHRFFSPDYPMPNVVLADAYNSVVLIDADREEPNDRMRTLLMPCSPEPS